ncbi:hypothetical protein BDZ94DRAFT_1241543 [Collybia nuda]|uniref:Uncharacterized protein n=1 Tax=Collybia nuda TaxID=64659 RepID=A0A9P5XT80_9AGAR|nr:hypothetical protein BDZ94DRAFT_1241543 [Collybia nuda]
MALSHESTRAVAGVVEMASSESVSSAPTSTHGHIESRLSHNFKVAAKGALWTLGKAAEGLPIPGAKAIFTSIYKIIDVVEVAQENQEGFRVLANQCQELMDTILEPLKARIW